MTNTKKILSLTALAFIAFFAMIGFVSAAPNITVSNNIYPSSVKHDSGSFQINFTITNNGEPANISFELEMTQGNAGGLSPQRITIPTGESPIAITVNFPKDQASILQEGFLKGNLIGRASSGENILIPFDIKIASLPFCKSGEVGGDLEIRKVTISNKGSGKKEDWKLLDRIEVTVEVQNKGDESLDDVTVELGLFDKKGSNLARDLDFENQGEEEILIGRIRSDKRESATFSFRVPADFTDGTYKLAVKVYSDDEGEDKQCTSTSRDLKSDNQYTEIDIEREDDEGRFIAFDNIRLTPVEGTCGDRVLMTLDAYNIGDEDQDQVRILLRNTELGIDKFIEIRNGMDEGDKESLSFEFVIPANAQDKFYNLALSAEYDYRNGIYRQRLKDDVIVQYRVIGCGTPSTPTTKIATISAALESQQVIAGGKVVVKATITNLKQQRTAFAIDALGYQSWSTLDQISPRILDLKPNESKDVLLTFNIDSGAAGEKSFEIEVKDGLGGTESREIALNIEGAAPASNGFLDFNLGDNAFLWVIGAVNVILVILIIVVAVKVARR